MGIKYEKYPLVVEQDNCLTKTVNIYIVYDLDGWPKILFKTFTTTNCLFDGTSIVKNSDKEKWVYSGYGTTFDGKVELSFGDDFT